MPELPEVEYAAGVLRRAMVGGTVRDVRILHDALRRRASPAALRGLRGRTVARVERRGKHQLIVLDGGVVVHVHFRMSGDWHVGRVGEPLPRHARATLALDDGTQVALVDPRALATLSVHRADELTFDDLGPEATDPALDGAALGARLARRRGPVKPALLDQRVVAGLGNIYAAEALWHARVSPLAPAARLDARRLGAIVRGMRKALALADRDPGRYSRGEATARLAVYGREGEPCRRCGGPIARIVQAGRSTYYCPACQPE
jgi:formamidopyrimidine-DNA glycosylase